MVQDAVPVRVRRYARRVKCLPTQPVDFGKPIAKKVLKPEEEVEHGQSEETPATETAGTDAD